MKKLTGALFVFGAIVVNIPYALLISNFNYPDILREPAGDILTKFAQGGSGLIYTWLFFALSGIPLLFGTILLGSYWSSASKHLVKLATTFGVIGFVAQLVGLLRWVFVVPVLSTNFTSPQTTAATKDASVVVFQVLNQIGGVMIGEYIGQLFSILSMLLFSVLILKQQLLPKWIAYLGFLASAVYILAQGELYHTTIPSFPVIEIAGLLGSMLWLVWLLVLGIALIVKKDQNPLV